MSSYDRAEARIGRRRFPRFLCSMAARFTTSHASHKVTLANLTSMGAHVVLEQPQLVSAGRLKWLRFEVFAQVVWQDRHSCGLVFEEPLVEDWLLETKGYAEAIERDRSGKVLKLASAWVYGPGDF